MSTTATTTTTTTQTTTTTMATDNSVLNLKPPDMTSDPSQFLFYEKKMRPWSRLGNHSHRFLTQIPTSNPLIEKLEEENGESTEAATKGVEAILEKLRKRSELSPTRQDQESHYGNKTLIIGNDEGRAKELTRFLYSSSDTHNFVTKSYDGEVGLNKIYNINYELNGKNASTKYEYGSKVIIDTGAPTTMCGLIWFKNYHQQMPKAMRSRLILQPSERPFFEFGGGEKRSSLGKVLIPGIVLDEDHQAHQIQIAVEIVDVDLPMLLGANSLNKAEGTITAGAFPYLSLIHI